MSYKVNHLHCKSPDPRKTAEWYVQHLGAKVVSDNKNADGTVSMRLDLHGVGMNVTGFIAAQKCEQHYGLEHVAVEAKNYDTDLAKIKASGAKILEERSAPDGRRVCFLEGPEGVRLELMEWR